MASTRPTGTPIADAVKQLSRDGVRWMSAEAELAQAELAVASRRAMRAFGLAIAAGAFALAALVVIAFAAIAVLVPYVGAAWASAIVGAVLLLFTAFLALSAYRIAVSTAEVATFIKDRINAFRRLRT